MAGISPKEKRKRVALGKDVMEKYTYSKKYKHVKCDHCAAIGRIIPLGRVFHNHGNKQFKCGSCGHLWQYGTEL